MSEFRACYPKNYKSCMHGGLYFNLDFFFLIIPKNPPRPSTAEVAKMVGSGTIDKLVNIDRLQYTCTCLHSLGRNYKIYRWNWGGNRGKLREAASWPDLHLLWYWLVVQSDYVPTNRNCLYSGDPSYFSLEIQISHMSCNFYRSRFTSETI